VVAPVDGLGGDPGGEAEGQLVERQHYTNANAGGRGLALGITLPLRTAIVYEYREIQLFPSNCTYRWEELAMHSSLNIIRGAPL
jgi:hypothetical protein